MEFTNNDLAESISGIFSLDAYQSDFYLHALNAPGPDDEEEEEEENGDDNPPIDEEVVYAPLTPQTGGMPT